MSNHGNASTAASKEILFAQQPILDANECVVAYELLFRGNFEKVDGDSASAQVFLNAFDLDHFESIGLNTPLFINFPQDLLFEVPPFNPKRFVIEVLEDVEPTPQVVAQVAKLKQQGYTIALDDFIYSEAHIPLLRLADVVKLDVMQTDMATIAEWLPHIRAHDIRLLAEKVETHEVFEACKDFGIELFQGYFFARPKLVEGRTISPNKASVLSLIAAFQDPNVDSKVLAEIIAADSGLTYKILKLVNSAAYRTTVTVDSIGGAILRLGHARIRGLSTLFALSELDAKPAELQQYTIYRASLCEHLGAQLKSAPDPEAFHMMGILSCCDAYFDMPLKNLVENLPLSNSLKAALLAGEGPLGIVLNAAIQLQEARWQFLNWAALESIGLDKTTVTAVFHESFAWTNRE